MSAPRTNADIAEYLDGCATRSELRATDYKERYGERGAARVIALLRSDAKAMREAIAALRKEPPALPAEVEAVLAELDEVTAESTGLVPADFEDNDSDHAESLADLVERLTHGCNSAATLLRRYAQAVAEKDAEIARLTSEIAGPCPCDVHACLATVAEKDAEIARLTEKHAAFERIDGTHLASLEKKLQAVEALCDEWDDVYALELATLRNDMPYEIDPAVRHHLEAVGELRKILREEH